MPWQPVFDSCGMAGGNSFEVFNAGAYNATPNAKQVRAVAFSFLCQLFEKYGT